MRPTARHDRIVPAVVAALLTAPTLIAYYPPMTDLPLHEAMVGALLHRGDPSWFPPGLLTTNLGHSNQLVHVLGWALAHIVGTRWAMKLLVAAAQAGIVLGGARTATHLGRAPVAASLLAPLALGATFYWGLVANLLGLACLLWCLPIFDSAARAPTKGRAAKASLAMILLFFAHESVVLVAMSLVVVLVLSSREHRARGVALGLLPGAVGAAIVAAHHAWSQSLVTEGMIATGLERTPVVQRLAALPRALFGAHDAEGLVLASALTVLALVGLRVSSRNRGPVRRFLVASAGLFALYLVFPSAYGSMSMMHDRFLAPAWALFVLAFAPAGRVRPLGLVAASTPPLAVLVLAVPQFVDSDRVHRDVARLLADVPRGSAVTVVVPDGPGDRRRIYSTATAPSRSVALVGGRAGLSLAISEFAPVQIAPALRWDEYERRLLGLGTLSLRPRYDLKRFGYVLARTPDEPNARALLAAAFGEDAAPVAVAGEWTLFRSTHDVAPVDAPAIVGPEGAETLRDRLRRLTRGARPPTTTR